MSAAPATAPPQPVWSPEIMTVVQPWHAPPLVRVPPDRRDAIKAALADAGFETWEYGDGAEIPLLALFQPYATLVFTKWETDREAAQRVIDGLSGA